MSQSARSHQWSERLIRLEPLIRCCGNMADPVCIRPDSQQGPASDNHIRSILSKDETLMIYLRFLTLLRPSLGLLTRTAADRAPPPRVSFSALTVDCSFQDGVDVSRDPGGNLLPLHLAVRWCCQWRPSLVGIMLSVNLTSSHPGWTGTPLNPLQPFGFTGETLHGWKLTLPSQQATSYLVRETHDELFNFPQNEINVATVGSDWSKYSDIFNCRSAPVTRLLYSLFSRSAANILLLEGDRRQVFCNSPCGSIVCLLLCTGECPIVQ